MKNSTLWTKKLGAGALVLLVTCMASALTLGRGRGAVIIGQPLDVAVEARLEAPGEDPTGCFSAEVFYGDARLPPGLVSVATQASPPSPDLRVRVRASRPVDEPMVTVFLRAGCTQAFTRRYLWLSDPPSDTSVVGPVAGEAGGAGAVPLPVDPAVVAAAPAASAVSPPASGAGPARGAARPSAQTGGASAAASATRSDAPAGTSRPRAVGGMPRVATGSGRPRLRLDPIDLSVEPDATLRVSRALLTEPTEDTAVRASAAALWRALNSGPEALLQGDEKTAALEADLAALRELAAKNQTSLSELRSALERAERERYANPLVYLLGLLLIAACAAAAVLWQRSRRLATNSDWWRGAQQDSLRLAPDEPLSPAASNASGVAQTAAVELDVDLDFGPSGPASTLDKTMTVPPRRHGPDFVSSSLGAGRAVNVEELFDIQQQADFFASLGQHDQAIELLRAHIEDSSQTSPLAYLDLLELYHRTGRTADFEKLRSEFNRTFTAEVPTFAQFTPSAGSGLESYQLALSRIEALWPSPKVLDVIEESIFRRPGGDGEAAFDLQAYRELLFLYAVAKDIVEREGGDLELVSVSPSGGQDRPRPRFSATALEPLSAHIVAAADAVSVNDGTQPIPTPPRSPRLGIDIDLEAFGEPSDVQQPGEPVARLDDDTQRSGDTTGTSGPDQAKGDRASEAAPPVRESVLDEVRGDRVGDRDDLPEPSLQLDDSVLDSEPPQDGKESLADFELFDPDIERELEPRTTGRSGLGS